ncbi:hypothetical protein AMK59_6057, partial [Oryctes borbonicus]
MHLSRSYLGNYVSHSLIMGKTFLSIFRLALATSTTRKIGSIGVRFAVKNTDIYTKVVNMGCSTSKTELENFGSDQYVEEIVCKADEIGENEMKSLDLGEEGKILLIKQNGKLSAIGAKCTHSGAPLVTGALGNGRVRCPWHGACFNITTGDIEDFPGKTI